MGRQGKEIVRTVMRGRGSKEQRVWELVGMKGIRLEPR